MLDIAETTRKVEMLIVKLSALVEHWHGMRLGKRAMVEYAKPKTSTDPMAQCTMKALANCTSWTFRLRDARNRRMRWLGHCRNRPRIPASGKENLKV